MIHLCHLKNDSGKIKSILLCQIINQLKNCLGFVFGGGNLNSSQFVFCWAGQTCKKWTKDENSNISYQSLNS